MNKSKGLLAIAALLVIVYVGFNWLTGSGQGPIENTNSRPDRNKTSTTQQSKNEEQTGTANTAPQSAILHEQLKDVRLMGVVASDEESQASAIIESGIHTQTYFLGEQIAYTTAILTQVMNDRVTLTIDEQDFVLLLVGSPASQAKSSSTSTPDPIHEVELAIAREIGTRPKKLEHIVTLSNQINGNQSGGYLVLPGLNPALFRSAGFKEGDVLEKVNGHELSDPEQFEKVVALIPRAETLVFTVLRGGRIVTLYLDIPSEELKISR